MAKVKKTAALCACSVAALALSISPADAVSSPSASAALFTPHSANTSSALLTLATADVDADRVWLKFEELVLSRARKTPLILYFDGGSSADCDESPSTERDGDDDDTEAEAEAEVLFQEPSESVSSEKEQQEECRAALAQQNALLLPAMEKVALANRASGLQIVRVPEELMTQMLRYHRVTTRPSLLWLAPRSSKAFQRYPHPETNALELSAPEKLIEVFSNSNTNSRTQPNTAATAGTNTDTNANTNSPSLLTHEQQLTAVISEFIRQWHVKSGLASKSGTNVQQQQQQRQEPESDTFSVADFVPVLGLLAFLGFVVCDNLEILTKTLQGRFVWFMWSLGVMFVAYSGLFHSIIHQMSLFYFTPQHGLFLFHPSARRQFMLEGLLSGSWSFFVSLGAFSVVEVLPMERSRSARNEIFWYSLFIVGVAYTILHTTFLTKNKWLAN